MIKTKIAYGGEGGTAGADPSLPTTGRPVLVTPKGPISMRNMRKEPTQEELVSTQFKHRVKHTVIKLIFTLPMVMLFEGQHFLDNSLI